MSYYFTKAAFKKEINDRLKIENEIKRRMEGSSTDETPKSRELMSFSDLIGDEVMTRSLALVELKKYMLPNDAQQALQFLESRREVALYLQLSNKFREHIGNPVYYAYDTFRIAWPAFTEEPKTGIQTAVYTDMIAKDVKEKEKEFLQKYKEGVNVEGEDILGDEEMERDELIEQEKEAKEEAKEKANKRKEKEKIEKEKIEKAIDDFSKVGSTFGPDGRAADLRDIEMLIDSVKAYGKAGKLKGDTKLNVINKMNEIINVHKLSLGEIKKQDFKIKDLLTPLDVIKKELERLIPTGSGLKRAKKSDKTKYTKDQIARLNILKGEVAAGNTRLKRYI